MNKRMVRKIIGAMLLCIPFVGMATFMVITSGWTCVFVVFGGSFAVVAVIVAGVMLLSWDD